MATSTNTAPNPGLIFDTLNAHQKTAALRGAIELDLFTAIGDGASVPALARRCSASGKGMRVLCDFLTVAGFLEKRGTEYRLTPDSALFLDKRSPAYLGTVVQFIGASEMTEAFSDVAGLVRKGGTLMANGGTVAPEHPIWVEFARSMAPMMRMPAESMAVLAGAERGEKWKVLDIACGHGLFGIAVAAKNPNVDIVGVDWAPVLAVAKENARNAGIDGRYKTIAGSVFDVDLGSGYDLVLLTNFLHHFNPADCERLLRKVHAAMKPGARALTLEFIPNEDRVSPPTQAMFAMMMLGTTAEGDAYTFSELQRMFANAGFTRSELNELGPAQRVVVSYR